MNLFENEDLTTSFNNRDRSSLQVNLRKNLDKYI